MSKYNESVLTTAGLELATRAFRGQAKFTITRTATTADTLTEAGIKGLAKLPNEKQTGTLTSSLDTPDGDEQIAGTKVLYTNEKVTKGYEISAIGLYAKEEGKDTEFLYAVTLAAEPEYIPDFGDKVLFEFGMSIFVVVGQKQNVTIQLNPQSLATIEYVDKAIADHQVVFPSDLAYVDKDEMISGKWKFGQNPVDKDGDEYVSGKVAHADAETVATSHATSAIQQANQYTDNKVKPLVKTADAANWQQQRLFNVGSYNIGTATTDYKAYVEANFSKAGVYYIRLQNETDTDANGVKISAMDTHLISEGGGWYYADGISMKGEWLFRRWSSTVDTGWKVAVDNVSTENFQKNKITADNGELYDGVNVSDNITFHQWLLNLPVGFHTIYCQAGVIGNPSGSAEPLRGYIHITNKTSTNVIGSGEVRGLFSRKLWTININAQALNNIANVFIDEKVGVGDQIGGNLIPNSVDFVLTNHWGADTYPVQNATHPFYKNGSGRLLVWKTTQSHVENPISSDHFAVIPGATYTVEANGFMSANVEGIDIWFLGSKTVGSTAYDTPIELVNNVKWSNTSNTSTSVATFTVPAGIVQGYIRIDNNGSADGKDASAYLMSVQMVQSTHKVPMAPAFSDFARDNGDGTVTVNGVVYTPADNANVSHRNPNTGVISEKSDFTQLTVNGGKTVATSDDLKSVEAKAWRPLTLVNSTSGMVLFKDNGNGTASLSGAGTFTIPKGTTVVTPIIEPPMGYQFTSLGWNKGTFKNGIWANFGVTGTSGGTWHELPSILQNGNICLKGDPNDNLTILFNVSKSMTDNTSGSGDPAIVGITKTS